VAILTQLLLLLLLVLQCGLLLVLRLLMMIQVLFGICLIRARPATMWFLHPLTLECVSWPTVLLLLLLLRVGLAGSAQLRL
jgi:hypothetical protein